MPKLHINGKWVFCSLSLLVFQVLVWKQNVLLRLCKFSVFSRHYKLEFLKVEDCIIKESWPIDNIPLRFLEAHLNLKKKFLPQFLNFMVWLLCTTRGDFFIQSNCPPTFFPTLYVVVELIWFYRCATRARLWTHSLLSVLCCMSTRCIDCLLDRWRRWDTENWPFGILESSFCVTLCTKKESRKTSFPCRWNKLAAMQRD